MRRNGTENRLYNLSQPPRRLALSDAEREVNFDRIYRIGRINPPSPKATKGRQDQLHEMERNGTENRLYNLSQPPGRLTLSDAERVTFETNVLKKVGDRRPEREMNFDRMDKIERINPPSPKATEGRQDQWHEMALNGRKNRLSGKSTRRKDSREEMGN